MEKTSSTESDKGAQGRRLLRIAEAADVLAVSTRTIWRLIALCELDAVRLGRAVRVKRASVDALIERGGVK